MEFSKLKTVMKNSDIARAKLEWTYYDMLELSVGKIWISENASTYILDFEQPVYMFFSERIVC